MLRTFNSRFLSLATIVAFASTARAQDHGLKVPPGFKVTLYADQTLANDIYCMTLDDDGRVIVSSCGWVKRLIDSDGDGRADKSELVANTVSGAMGLCWWGNYENSNFMMTADGWLSLNGRDKI